SRDRLPDRPGRAAAPARAPPMGAASLALRSGAPPAPPPPGGPARDGGRPACAQGPDSGDVASLPGAPRGAVRAHPAHAPRTGPTPQRLPAAPAPGRTPSSRGAPSRRSTTPARPPPDPAAPQIPRSEREVL